MVRQQPQAENGEIVAAMIDGETTIKTLQRVKGQVGHAAQPRVPADSREGRHYPRQGGYRTSPRLTVDQAFGDLNLPVSGALRL